jgi:hypothetical protein
LRRSRLVGSSDCGCKCAVDDRRAPEHGDVRGASRRSPGRFTLWSNRHDRLFTS